jgi:tRNA 2-thiouridine synthesizing protein A
MRSGDNSVAGKPRADKVLDVRGWSCPWCILKTRSELTRMNQGQILEVLGTDPQAMRSLPVVLGRAGDEVLAVEDGPEFFRLYLRRGFTGGCGEDADPLSERKGANHGSD